VLVNDGNTQVWEEASRQSQSIYRAGDAVARTMSSDGQLVAFLRRTESDGLHVNQINGNVSRLVAMDYNGEPGTSDTIGITVWNKNGGLWFSSRAHTVAFIARVRFICISPVATFPTSTFQISDNRAVQR
jgi:hypothetical protein